jgi:hypothetical protein
VMSMCAAPACSAASECYDAGLEGEEARLEDFDMGGTIVSAVRGVTKPLQPHPLAGTVFFDRYHDSGVTLGISVFSDTVPLSGSVRARADTAMSSHLALECPWKQLSPGQRKGCLQH